MLNERKIKELCEINGYNYNYFGDSTIVTTGVDQWNLQSVEVYDRYKKSYVDKIMLKHKNIKGNRSGKEHYHKQRYTENIGCAFNTIVMHQENHRDFNKAFRIKSIINTNNDKKLQVY